MQGISKKSNIEFAAKHGFSYDDLGKMLFVVNDKGESMILMFSSSNVDRHKVMKKNNITAAVAYSGSNLTGITFGFNTWNGTDNGIFEKYCADARINRTSRDCVEEIIKDSNCEITRLA